MVSFGLNRFYYNLLFTTTSLHLLYRNVRSLFTCAFVVLLRHFINFSACSILANARDSQRCMLACIFSDFFSLLTKEFSFLSDFLLFAKCDALLQTCRSCVWNIAFRVLVLDFRILMCTTLRICYFIGCFFPCRYSIFLAHLDYSFAFFFWNYKQEPFSLFLFSSFKMQWGRKKKKKLRWRLHILNECVSCCSKMMFKFSLFFFHLIFRSTVLFCLSSFCYLFIHTVPRRYSAPVWLFQLSLSLSVECLTLQNLW